MRSGVIAVARSNLCRHTVEAIFVFPLEQHDTESR